MKKRILALIKAICFTIYCGTIVCAQQKDDFIKKQPANILLKNLFFCVTPLQYLRSQINEQNLNPEVYKTTFEEQAEILNQIKKDRQKQQPEPTNPWKTVTVKEQQKQQSLEEQHDDIVVQEIINSIKSSEAYKNYMQFYNEKLYEITYKYTEKESIRIEKIKDHYQNILSAFKFGSVESILDINEQSKINKMTTVKDGVPTDNNIKTLVENKLEKELAKDTNIFILSINPKADPVAIKK
jgi:hypothetical protein